MFEFIIIIITLHFCDTHFHPCMQTLLDALELDLDAPTAACDGDKWGNPRWVEFESYV